MADGANTDPNTPPATSAWTPKPKPWLLHSRNAQSRPLFVECAQDMGNSMILGHIRLCKRCIDKILTLWVIMLLGDLRPERIAIRKMQDFHLSKLQIIYRILKGAVVSYQKTSRSPEENTYLSFSQFLRGSTHP